MLTKLLRHTTTQTCRISLAQWKGVGFLNQREYTHKILCVDLQRSIAENSCLPELIQRGHQVDQFQSVFVDIECDPDAGPANRSGFANLEKILPEYDALLISPKTKLSRSILKQGSQAKLRMIATPSRRFDSTNVDVMEATSQDIMLLQLDERQLGESFSVEAEKAFTLLLQLVYPVPSEHTDSKKSISGSETSNFGGENSFAKPLQRKKLGIIGFGRTGSCVAEMAKAFDLQVAIYDPNISEGKAKMLGFTYCDSLLELYRDCEIISFHAPLTGKTRSMFDDDALYNCKDGVILISVAEHSDQIGLFQKDTLVKGVQSGKIGGLGIDLLHESSDAASIGPFPDGLRGLETSPNVLVRGHQKPIRTAAMDHVNSTHFYRAIAENLSNALARRGYRGVSNGIFMSWTLLPEMQPFIQLGEAMGKFVHQYMSLQDAQENSVASISVATTGGISADLSTPKARLVVQNAIMKGFLFTERACDQHRSSEKTQSHRLSLLNASFLAMSSGIDVRFVENAENAQAVQHLNNSITVNVRTQQDQHLSVTGSVFGEEPRIVRIDEYNNFPSFRPEGNLLLFRNQDLPGVVARILKELAISKINIANFGLARQDNVPLALGILALDAPPSTTTMATLRDLKDVESLQMVQI
uniref:Uncharacterized protein ALNC14_087130 n=1 Tax=Albugo laibachii Nc14 TaxID=890382 RepID=F0WMN6_9STRA|nr:unnamed protein product [Albugo laibachii Nc14]|eukprot:CCA22570.1 unnamed protein product [Albugo laibachii Nc14]